MGRGRPPLSDEPVDVGAAPDPVAAVLAAHAAGRRLALRTSGSTGRARVVLRTSASWFDSFPVVAGLTGLGPGSRLHVPGPLAGTMNLFASVLGRVVGALPVSTLAEATHAHLTPSALSRSLDADQGVDQGVGQGVDQGAGDNIDGVHVTVAGDRLPLTLHDRALAAGAEVSHYYGAAELSFVAWGSHEDDLRPFPQVEIDVRDGEVWVRSPFLCEGYDGHPGALRRDPSGFATVGDRGTLQGDLLKVAGRGSEAVTTGAVTVLVADVEAVLRPAVTGEVVVVGVPHPELGEVVAAVVTCREDLQRARQAARGLAPVQRPRRWAHLPLLPLTAAGKVDRAEVVAALARPLARDRGPGVAGGAP